MVKKRHRKMAAKRIEILFKKAESAALAGEVNRANRYTHLARKIGMRYNVTIPSQYRRRFCKRCYSYLMPSVTCRARVRNGMVVTRCSECGYINRYGYSKRSGEHG